MRTINVITPFNLVLPSADGGELPLRHFDVGTHEVGTYQRPVWDREKDAPVPGAFETLEIADHSFVKLHCGKPPSASELLAKAAKLRQEAAELAAQAEQAEQIATIERNSEQLAISPPEPMGLGVIPNTRAVGNGSVLPNTRLGYGSGA